MITVFPSLIAYNSPDYLAQQLPDLKMSFSAAEDNSTDQIFIASVAEYLANKGISRINCLDLGCGGGQLIVDLHQRPFTGICVGLDGVSGTLGRTNWASGLLLSADISKKFTVFDEDRPILFDLITSWEVIEHLDPLDLKTFFDNVINHLTNDGIFLCSIAMFPDTRDKNGYHQDCPEFDSEGEHYVLHRSVFSKEKWYEILKDYNISEYPLKSPNYRCGYIAPRDHPSHNGKGGSLYLMVTK